METINDTMEENIKKVIISSFETDIAKLDETYDKTYTLRDKLVNKLISVVDDTNISPQGDPDLTHAQLAIFNSASNLLNDIDKQILNKANLKLKVKQGDSEDEDRKQIIEILNNYSLKELDTVYEPQNLEEIEKDLDEEIERRALDIKDGELIDDPKNTPLTNNDEDEKDKK
jgi:hypothetical protein